MLNNKIIKCHFFLLVKLFYQLTKITNWPYTFQFSPALRDHVTLYTVCSLPFSLSLSPCITAVNYIVLH